MSVFMKGNQNVDFFFRNLLILTISIKTFFLKIYFRSSKPVHDLLDSFANLVETTCQTCGEKDKSGLINGQQDLNLQNEKNTTEAVFSADNVNDQQVCCSFYLCLEILILNFEIILK